MRFMMILLFLWIFIFHKVTCLGYGSIRSDYYLDPKVYKENEFEIPVDNWRVHLVGSFSKDFKLPITSVKINGIEGFTLPENMNFTYLDWLRAYYDSETNQYWISFHSRYKNWFNVTVVKFYVSVTDSNQKEYFDTCIVILDNLFKITYFTTRKNGDEGIIHLHNYDQSQTWNVKKFVVDGKGYDNKVSLPPNEHHVIVITMPKKKTRGDIWTITVFTDNTVFCVGNGGKVVSEFFSVEAWAHSSDCPFPKINDAAYDKYSSNGINTIFYNDKNFQKSCKTDFKDYFENVLPQYPDYYTIIETSDGFSGLTNFDQILMRFLGDEPDGSDDYEKNIRNILKLQFDTDKQYPVLPTYVGGNTNRRAGIFSGITDIRGLDFYIAACAPCIIPAIHNVPLDSSFQYCRNIRNNHMPNPSMTYSQLYSQAWSYQAHENELYVQIMSAIMAGSKGIMLFQGEMDKFPSDFDSTVGALLRSVRYIGPVIRGGDIESCIIELDNKNDTLKYVEIQTIRTDYQLIILLFSKDAWGYSQLSCHIELLRHWKFRDHTVNGIKLRSQQISRGVADVREVVNGTEIALQKGAEIEWENGKITLDNVEFTSDRPMRIFVMKYS